MTPEPKKIGKKEVKKIEQIYYMSEEIKKDRRLFIEEINNMKPGEKLFFPMSSVPRKYSPEIMHGVKDHLVNRKSECICEWWDENKERICFCEVCHGQEFVKYLGEYGLFVECEIVDRLKWAKEWGHDERHLTRQRYNQLL